jgi:subfamily B ATP-binding cassette protein MsbA
MNDIRKECFRLLLDVDLDFYNCNQLGDIVRKINGETSRTTGTIVSCISLVNVSAMILIFSGTLVLMSPELTIVVIGLFILVTLSTQFLVKRAKKFGRELTQRTKDLTVHIMEVLSGIQVIKTVASEDREYNKLLELMYAHEQSEYQSRANSAILGPFNEVTSIVVLTIVIFAARFIFSSDTSPFAAVSLIYLVFLFRLLPFIGQLNTLRASIANNSSSVELVEDFLSRENKAFMPQGDKIFSGLNHKITFQDISFSYPGHRKDVIKSFNLELLKGQTVALVGSSGSGKSTLAKLLARFYDPTNGTIYIDDTDLKEFSLKQFRKHVGVVSQDTFLFSNTAWYNVTYARPDASEAEVIEAVKRANAYDFIQELPQGWNTYLGDRGITLSGGQRQRISIARALLQDPEILILDEATSALDTVSERLVQDAIDDLSRDRTTLVIAHRLSTIKNADLILVLKGGEVIEQGDHQSLLASNGEYAKLWSMQFTQDNLNSEILGTEKPALSRSTTSSLSYQLRNYLNSIIGSLQLLESGIIEEEEERQELTIEASHSAAQTLRILEKLEQ